MPEKRTAEFHAAMPPHPAPPEGVLEGAEEELLAGGVELVGGVELEGVEPVEVPILLRILSHLLSG